MLRLLVLALALFISACSATGQKYTEMAASTPAVAPDKARVYFYRKDAFMLGGRSAPISINGVIAGECANAGFFYTDLKPGNHVFSTELWDAPGKYSLYYNAEQGKTHYIQVAPREDAVTAGVLFGVIGMAIESGDKDKGGAFALLPMTPAQANSDLATLAYSGTAESASVSRDFGTANISQPTQTTGHATSTPQTKPVIAPKAAGTKSTNTSSAPKKTIAAGSWGSLPGHSERVPEGVFSGMITKLMLNNLRNTGLGEVKPIGWQQARAIEYESNDYPQSKATCKSTGADVLYVNVVESTVAGGTGNYPSSTYYLFDCARGEKQYKTYTLDLNVDDGANFKYEVTLNKTFRDFLAKHNQALPLAAAQ